MSLCLAGCGGGGAAADVDPVVDPVYSLGDAAYSEQMFPTLFADGAVPENRGDYARLSFAVVGEPEVTGESATVTVKLTPLGNESAGGEIPAATAALPQGPVEVKWTLKKSGGAWKIHEAPLG